MIKKEQLEALVQLANADGNLAEEEKQFIRTIASAHGYTRVDVEKLFTEKHEIILTTELSLDQRVEFALTLTQLMLIDKKMYLKELQFCTNVIRRLGFEREFIYRLVDLVSEKKDNIQVVKEEALKFLKSRK